MSRPTAGTYPTYFDNYVNQVKENNLFDAFKSQQTAIDDFFSSIPENKTNLGYEVGKWSLKELLQHIIDVERIFNYRALCIARKEKISLPGFDENNYAENSNANNRTWESLCTELKILRKSTIIMYENFTEDSLNNSGISNNNPTTVLVFGFITVGHISHHIRIIKERYLI